MWNRKDTRKPPSISLTATDVYLRPATVYDYAKWVDVRQRNQAVLKPYEPAWLTGCFDQEFFKRRIERLNREWLTDHTYAFLVFTVDGNHLIGGININNVMRGAGQMASLGYWLDQEQQGRGRMTQAARAVLDYAFSTLDLARINAATLVHNEKSRNMLLRLGFTEEGFARAYIQIDGRRQDHVLYGLNAADFSRPS